MAYTGVKISGWVEDDFKIRKGSDAYGLLFYLALSDPDVAEEVIELCCLAYGGIRKQL